MAYSANDIVNKTLIAKKKVNVYSLPVAETKYKIAFIKAGNFCGVVHSYVERSDGLWWQFISGSAYYYIKHQTGTFDISSLKSQGVLSVEEKAKAEAEAEMNWLKKLGYNIKDWVQEKQDESRKDLNKIIVIAGLVLVGYAIVKFEGRNFMFKKLLKR